METEAVRDVRELIDVGDTNDYVHGETAKPELGAALSLYFRRSKENRAKVAKLLSASMKQSRGAAGLKVIEIQKEIGTEGDETKLKKEMNLRLAAAGVVTLSKAIERAYALWRAEVEANMVGGDDDSDKPKKDDQEEKKKDRKRKKSEDDEEEKDKEKKAGSSKDQKERDDDKKEKKRGRSKQKSEERSDRKRSMKPEGSHSSSSQSGRSDGDKGKKRSKKSDDEKKKSKSVKMQSRSKKIAKEKFRLSKEGRAKKIKHKKPRDRRSSTSSGKTVEQKADGSTSSSGQTKAQSARSHIKLGNRTIEVFNLYNIGTKMRAPRRTDLSLLASTAKRGGKQGAWRQKPKWTFVPQMSSHFKERVENNKIELTAGVLAMERATKFHVTVHTPEAVTHIAKACVPLLYVDAMPKWSGPSPGAARNPSRGRWPSAFESILVRPGKTELDRVANEPKGVLSKHDSMLKAADFESDFGTSCMGEFSLPDPVNIAPGKTLALKRFVTDLHQMFKMEKTQEVADLSGVCASINYNLRIIKDLRAYAEDTTNAAMKVRIVRAHQVKSDCTLAPHGEASWRPATDLVRAYSGSEHLARVNSLPRNLLLVECNSLVDIQAVALMAYFCHGERLAYHLEDIGSNNRVPQGCRGKPRVHSSVTVQLPKIGEFAIALYNARDASIENTALPTSISELLIAEIAVHNTSEQNLRQPAARMRYATDLIGTAADPYCVIVHNYFENLDHKPAEFIGLLQHGIQLLIHQFQVTEDVVL